MIIQIVGVGHTGEVIALNILTRIEPEEIILSDIDYEKACSQQLDLAASRSLERINTKITASKYPKEADLTVITAGKPRKRHDLQIADELLYQINIKTVRSIIKHIKHHAKCHKYIIVTNPAEAIAETIQKELGNGYEVRAAGKMIDQLRDGKLIVKGKGYTNLGIGTETLIEIKNALNPL